ncbi:MAG: DUF1801 domain-containing protein [Lacrimispora sp.]|uniref:DUF1801 domain-containing protein n=1 Tax=Lacrimispora sp. TaxID=2719234 RepID=UPI0039E2F8B2
MNHAADTPETYIENLPEEKRQAIELLRKTIKKSLPTGFEETMQYGMIGYVIPHSLYPAGYHVNPQEPLPFISLGAQKNHIALYHMGLYAFPDTLEWFTTEYSKHVKTKLDMGKSCLRFKKPDTIPYELIGELCQKITPQDYIEKYEMMAKGQGETGK